MLFINLFKKWLDHTKNDTSTFKKNYGESIKDGWFRINEMHDKVHNPCGEAKLKSEFLFWFGDWTRNVLDICKGGSFMLAPPDEDALVIDSFFFGKTSMQET
jgi:hypothetical protein